MAVSMGLKPIGIKKIGSTSGLGSWYLDGTPASCIKYGIDNIFKLHKKALACVVVPEGVQ